MFKPQDHYFKQAKKEGFKARSAFKLEEIDDKYHIFDKHTKTVLDIGCAPGSWLQYVSSKLKRLKVPGHKIVGFDIKPCAINIEGVHTYVQDIQDHEKIEQILQKLEVKKFDIIISDMAPNTIGLKDIDAMRSIGLLETTLPLYEKYLKHDGKFVIKIFMGPGFDEFIQAIRKIFGSKGIKVFKPAACRKESKETYIVRYLQN